MVKSVQRSVLPLVRTSQESPSNIQTTEKDSTFKSSTLYKCIGEDVEHNDGGGKEFVRLGRSEIVNDDEPAVIKKGESLATGIGCDVVSVKKSGELKEERVNKVTASYIFQHADIWKDSVFGYAFYGLIKIWQSKVLWCMFTCILCLTSQGAFAKEACSISLQTLKEVSSCPMDEESWNQAALLKNCSSVKQSCTKQDDFVYNCLITETDDRYVEVCAPKFNGIGHICLEFNVGGQRVQNHNEKPCSGCPYSYPSSESYKYPECYNLTGSTLGPMTQNITATPNILEKDHTTFPLWTLAIIIPAILAIPLLLGCFYLCRSKQREKLKGILPQWKNKRMRYDPEKEISTDTFTVEEKELVPNEGKINGD